MSKLDSEDEFFSACMTKAILGCLVICFSGGVLFDYLLNNAFNFEECSSGDSGFVEQQGRFQIPSNATHIETCNDIMGSGIVAARFKLPASELNNFLASTHLPQPLTSEIKPAHLWKWQDEIDSIDSYL